VAFSKFEDTNQALEAAAAMCEGKLDSGLKKFLKKSIVKKELTDQLGVIDAKLGSLIKSKLEIDCACFLHWLGVGGVCP
jgi:nucleolar protein 58